MTLIASQQVSWWSVHEFVAAVLDRVGRWPMVGTSTWAALDDSDPAKIAALFDAARHWALKVELNQEATCQAGKAISGAEDWSAIAQTIRAKREWYAGRPWLKRERAA
jgi:hypothetical protein